MKKTALILLLLVSSSALAQMGRNGYSGFALVTPAEVSVGEDNNFLVNRVSNDEKLLILSLPGSVLPAAPDLRPSRLQDKVFLIKAPTLAYLNDTERQELSIRYFPEIEIFVENGDQSSWNNTFAMDYSYKIARHWIASVGDEYLSSKDPSRTLQNPMLLLPRGQYRENLFRGGLTFQQSARTSITMQYDNTLTTFGERDPLQRRVLDTLASGGSFFVTRMLSRNQRLRVTYHVFNAQPWNHQKLNDDRVDSKFVSFQNPAHSVVGDYRFAMNSKTVLDLGGGATRTSTGTHWAASIFADRRLADVWIGGGYVRGLSVYAPGMRAPVLPNGLTANSFYDTVQAHAKGQLARNVGLLVMISGSRNVDGLVTNPNKTLIGRSRLDYRLSDRTVAFISAEVYNQNRNDYLGTPLERRRYFAGLSYSFLSEREQRVSRFKRDEETVGLTDHDRKNVRPPQ